MLPKDQSISGSRSAMSRAGRLEDCLVLGYSVHEMQLENGDAIGMVRDF